MHPVENEFVCVSALNVRSHASETKLLSGMDCMQQVLKYKAIIIYPGQEATQRGPDHWLFELSGTLLPSGVDIWYFVLKTAAPTVRCLDLVTCLQRNKTSPPRGTKIIPPMPPGTSNSHSIERCIKAATALLRGSWTSDAAHLWKQRFICNLKAP